MDALKPEQPNTVSCACHGEFAAQLSRIEKVVAGIAETIAERLARRKPRDRILRACDECSETFPAKGIKRFCSTACKNAWYKRLRRQALYGHD